MKPALEPEEYAIALLVEAIRLAHDGQAVPLSLLREALVLLGLDGSAALRVDAVECVPVGRAPREPVAPVGLEPSPW